MVFTKTAGYYHASIPDGVKAIIKLGREHHFRVDTTSDASKFTEDTLKQYSAVVFMSTTHDVLNNYQQADFERYIEAGGGYVGVHAAADCEYHWPWYGKLVGAWFKSHPSQQEAKLDIHKDKNFPITDSLPNPWIRTDEWYNFRAIPKDVHVLVSIDEKSYKGGENGAHHPMVWYHDYDGGRAFYMELGHTSESYQEPHFLELLWEGIHYAIGKNQVLDYSKATALRVPAEDRFSKKFLAGGLDEPTELTVLPDLSVLIAERKGNIKYYNAADKTITRVAHLEVYDKTLHTKNVNVEMGLLGIQADPHYDQNHWVYVYYSPTSKSVDRLSRFKFEKGQFNVKSEQVILEVHTDREICCHTGGSIAFDSKDNLYVSVGDNTTPFDEINPVTGKAYPINSHGYSPVDDRPGFEHFDDRRAAGNSNDLRGKILRIHVNEDGTYSIPAGNLFPKGTAKTRPEIYVMGDRNPYRISVDKHTGYLYWGEVGPDANNDSLATHGPRGYDEINQARKSGNFGWPYFVGDNYPYHAYNYATGAPGPVFDPEHVVNNSRNNTGLKVLPDAHPAFIWYPYAESPDFPILGKGGRCAMAGPVYYVNDYPEATRFPEYYNGKLFIYDWIRNWIMVVTMDKTGDLQTIEPFMPDTKFHNISDMETGPDGNIYIVEYGEGWFSKNANAALSVITYNGGNRPPVVNMKVDHLSGALPLKVHASAAGTLDPDGDKMTYLWNFGGDKVQTDTPGVDHTFTAAGVFPVSVTVSDGKGAETKSEVVHLFAGNSEPQVHIQLTGNPTFYFPQRPVAYQVTVDDPEDGNSGQPDFDPSRVFVKADYLQSADKAALPAGDVAAMAASLSGKSLMESMDCKSCHKVNEKSIGPAFKQVALRYAGNGKAVDFLSHKIIKGGSGNWGETAMAAHPGLSVSDAGKIVHWILSLADSSKEKSMPMNGTIQPSEKFKLTPQGAIVLSATYVDKGAKGVPSLTGITHVLLQHPSLNVTSAQSSSGVSDIKMKNNDIKLIGADSGWIKFPQISLQDVGSIEIHYGLSEASKKGWTAEVHLDNPQGTLLGRTVIGKSETAKKPLEASLRLTPSVGGSLHDVYFVFRKSAADEKGELGIMNFVLRPD
ncbi:MAG TPA: ThuA domain-containing protein [Chitinophagaceae bacterium]|nr:ThuA domain-containing protein [Chitinophagaceae bacterium]